jgi:hypothetical protein
MKRSVKNNLYSRKRSRKMKSRKMKSRKMKQRGKKTKRMRYRKKTNKKNLYGAGWETIRQEINDKRREIIDEEKRMDRRSAFLREGNGAFDVFGNPVPPPDKSMPAAVPEKMVSPDHMTTSESEKTDVSPIKSVEKSGDSLDDWLKGFKATDVEEAIGKVDPHHLGQPEKTKTSGSTGLGSSEKEDWSMIRTEPGYEAWENRRTGEVLFDS